MKTNNQNIQDNPKFVLTIIWAALLFSMFIYLYVLQTVPSSVETSQDQGLFNILVGIGIVSTFASQFFYQKALRTINVVMTAGGTKDEALKQGFVHLIITWALGESIAVLGLFLGFSGYDINSVYSFFGAAVILHLFRSPFRL